MNGYKKVKILATLGPSSSDEAVIQQLHEAGADLFRINMSHANHVMMRQLIGHIRNVEQRCGRPIGILADLQGPKLRVGKFAKGCAELRVGQNFILDNLEEAGDENRVFLPHPEIFASVQTGHRLLIDDGKVLLKVEKHDLNSITTRVIAGTKISDRKGVSLPDSLLSVGVLTEKDRADLDAILETNAIDWVALSFVQRPEDLQEVRKIVGQRVGLMAKIEKPQALEHIDEIINLSDALMVARGDLGVELPLETVPGHQKQLIRACRRAGKPVIVATQMLESMITAPVPTRAEVSDVATAVFEGADAIMLSAESAAGDYPVEAVTTMTSIACQVESDPLYAEIINKQGAAPEATAADAISLAARQIATTLNLAAIVCYTSSGTTSLRAARERPPVPIIALSPVVETARRLSLVWGLYCVTTDDTDNLDETIRRACNIVKREGFAKSGDNIIISAGVPFGIPGSTNMLRISRID
ncbi:pyruvate kinase [Paenochrobactrum gallinarii]|uniref:Pyruvate kinase n=1 Tax=Paenochrobactrum gallinarii TaxID=643673 RepID=A0A841MA00_9HYPH|nr:pyruvate kinase [Paenochrobactrum gallinarii]MBB6262364.1 pyruvate kinase [Paenochrobactrum gallinarii]